MTLERTADDRAALSSAAAAGALPRDGAIRGFGQTAPLFSVVFAVTYFICVGANLGPIRYHPLTGGLHVTPQPDEAGPAMMWYGWIVNATVVALIACGVAMLAPRPWLDALNGRGSWIVPSVGVGLFAALCYLLRGFFLH